MAYLWWLSRGSKCSSRQLVGEDPNPGKHRSRKIHHSVQQVSKLKKMVLQLCEFNSYSEPLYLHLRYSQSPYEVGFRHMASIGGQGMTDHHF